MMSAFSSPKDLGQHGCEHAADAERAEQEELEHAEYASQYLVRNSALNKRVAGDVDERVAGAHDREQHEGDRDT